MYQIGEFSRLCQVSIDTLRYYDSIDLLKPKKIDRYSGYRYYDNESVEEYYKILACRNLNYSLDEIKKQKENMSLELLEQKIKETKEKLTKEQGNLKQLEEMKKNWRGNNFMNDAVVVTKRDNQGIVCKFYTVKSKREVDQLLEEFKEYLKEEYLISTLNPVILNMELGYSEEDIDIYLGYFVKEEEIKKIKEDNISSIDHDKLRVILPYHDKLPKLTVICNRDDESIKNAYKSIITYANNYDYQIRGVFEEVYLDDKVEVRVEAKQKNKDNYTSEDEAELLNKRKKVNQEKLNNFIKDENILGSWELKEVLPDIHMFNPKKQKSTVDSKYREFTIYPDGTSNSSIVWSKGIFYFKEEEIFENYHIYIADNTKYLVLLFNEEDRPNVLPMCYIYEAKK